MNDQWDDYRMDALAWLYRFKFIRYIFGGKWYLTADYNRNKMFWLPYRAEGYHVLEFEDFTNQP